MPKHGHRITLDKALLAITALFVMGGFWALGFSQNESGENRALLVIVSSSGMIASLAGLMLVSVFWRRIRRWTWQRAMSNWDRISRAGVTPRFTLDNALPDHELRELAARSFSRMGYRVARRAADSVYLTLINPDGKLELVACKAQAAPLELHHVYSFELEMKRTRAACGFFWAPAGFSDETIDWAARRSIILADRLEIGRLVDCSRTRGLRSLET